MVLANKFDEKLGFFVVKMPEKGPDSNDGIKFLIKWKNKLDIGDTNMYILRTKKNSEDGEGGLKELIISFKTIYINTYNVVCMDITTDEEQLMIFRHESFQLWESECTGFLLNKNKDFVTLGKAGMEVLSLGSKDKRTI